MTAPSFSPCDYITSSTFDQKSCQFGEVLVKTYESLTGAGLPLVQKDPPAALLAAAALAPILAAGVAASAGSGAFKYSAKALGKALAAGAAAGTVASGTTATLSSLSAVDLLSIPLLPIILLDEFPKIWGGDTISDTIAQGLLSYFGPGPNWLTDAADALGL